MCHFETSFDVAILSDPDFACRGTCGSEASSEPRFLPKFAVKTMSLSSLHSTVCAPGRATGVMKSSRGEIKAAPSRLRQTFQAAFCIDNRQHARPTCSYIPSARRCDLLAQSR